MSTNKQIVVNTTAPRTTNRGNPWQNMGCSELKNILKIDPRYFGEKFRLTCAYFEKLTKLISRHVESGEKLRRLNQHPSSLPRNENEIWLKEKRKTI